MISAVILLGSFFYILKFFITAFVIVLLISLAYSGFVFSMLAPMLDFSK